MPIVVYIHICQMGEWKRTFTMLMDSIRAHGLYNELSEIRCGIVNETSTFVDGSDSLLDDPKIKVVYVGHSAEYERPTLLHMRRSVETDPDETKYLYLHTKGVKHYGHHTEPFVVDWIKLMLYWNIRQWHLAENILNTHDTFGCNYYVDPRHYSGNFFWLTAHHLKRLPTEIGPAYNDPEFWVCCLPDTNAYIAFNSRVNHYHVGFPESMYVVGEPTVPPTTPSLTGSSCSTATPRNEKQQ